MRSSLVLVLFIGVLAVFYQIEWLYFFVFALALALVFAENASPRQPSSASHSGGEGGDGGGASNQQVIVVQQPSQAPTFFDYFLSQQMSRASDNHEEGISTKRHKEIVKKMEEKNEDLKKAVVELEKIRKGEKK